MKRVHIEENWPESWKYSYPYDLEEVYGNDSNLGYAYAYDNRRKHTLRFLTEALPPGARILDVAAAQGNFSIALAEMGYIVTWNDLREDLAGYVRLKQECGEIEYAPGNAFELKFATPFDAVLMTEIIEHVAHPDEFLQKAAQLVKPGGFAVLTTPNGTYYISAIPFPSSLNARILAFMNRSSSNPILTATYSCCTRMNWRRWHLTRDWLLTGLSYLPIP